VWHVHRVVSSFPLVPSVHALSKRVSRRSSEGGTRLGCDEGYALAMYGEPCFMRMLLPPSDMLFFLETLT
jgi:hypothetical protein